jgi:hypothetical protein
LIKVIPVLCNDQPWIIHHKFLLELRMSLLLMGLLCLRGGDCRSWLCGCYGLIVDLGVYMYIFQFEQLKIEFFWYYIFWGQTGIGVLHGFYEETLYTKYKSFPTQNPINPKHQKQPTPNPLPQNRQRPKNHTSPPYNN